MAVYFAQQGTDGPVKIGWSRSVARRIQALDTGSPVSITLLVEIDGPRSLESALHCYLAGARVRGEWFEPSGEVLEIGPVLRDGLATIDDFLSGRCELNYDGLWWSTR